MIRKNQKKGTELPKLVKVTKKQEEEDDSSEFIGTIIPLGDNMYLKGYANGFTVSQDLPGKQSRVLSYHAKASHALSSLLIHKSTQLGEQTLKSFIAELEKIEEDLELVIEQYFKEQSKKPSKIAATVSKEPEAESTPAPKRRGRPPKAKEAATEQPKKKRGRHKKTV